MSQGKFSNVSTFFVEKIKEKKLKEHATFICTSENSFEKRTFLFIDTLTEVLT